MGVYIKTKNGLKKVSVDGGSSTNPTPAEVTAESIKTALGYTPADADKVANINDDESEEFSIVDKDGNIIFKIDAEGIHTTGIEADSITLNGEAVTPGGTNSGDANIPSIEGLATEDYVDDKVAEMGERIVSNSEELHIVDGNGNVVATIDKDGVHTVEVYIGDKTVSDMILEAISEIDVNGGGILTESDPTVPDWAKQPTKPSYTASEVGALPSTTEIPSIEGLATEDYVDNAVAEMGEHIVSKSEELHIVDGNGNIVATIDATGLHTTAIEADNIEIKSDKYADGGTIITADDVGLNNPAILFKGRLDDEPVILRNIANPTSGTDVANKNYVDEKIASLPSNDSEMGNTFEQIIIKTDDWDDGGVVIRDIGNSENEPVLEFSSNANGNAVRVANIDIPKYSYDAANKKYVDSPTNYTTRHWIFGHVINTGVVNPEITFSPKLEPEALYYAECIIGGAMYGGLMPTSVNSVNVNASNCTVFCLGDKTFTCSNTGHITCTSLTIASGDSISSFRVTRIM